MSYAIIRNSKYKRENLKGIYRHNESENNYLRKIINALKQTLKKVFIWISNKLSVSEEDELIRKFEADNDNYLDPKKQIEYEEELDEIYDLDF